jgi:N,N-dimethylformamidase
MRPNTTLYQFAADGYLTYWLHQQGFSVDTVTDEDLDKEGYSLIENHRVVITGNHPEYWSTRMWDAMQEFLDAGGRLMYLGGNGFYWRIAYSDVFPGVIEVRRAEDGTRPWVSAPGEYRLSFTGEMSGLWRRNNRTPNRLVGVGMTAQGFDRGTYYRRNPDSFDARAAFIFDGIGDDEIIGDFGFALDGASGQEIDRYDASLGSPTHALVVATSEGHGDNMLLVNEEYQSSHLMLGGTENPAVRSDMVFFETAAGGAVFSTGSISWISSLACNDCDNNVSTIIGNVLRRFVDGTSFHFPNGA